MDILVIFERMLMLLAMMGLGFISYKMKWLEDISFKKLSEIVINVFNPALTISLQGKFHRQRRLASYNPRGCRVGNHLAT